MNKRNARDFVRSDDAEERTQYDRLLREYETQGRAPRDAIAFLVSNGFTTGQARNAVYRFRQRKRAGRSD